MIKKRMLVFLSMIYFSCAVSVIAEEAPDVSVIVDKANKAAYYQGDDGKALVRMTITDSQGREREREFVILRKDKADGGDQLFYVYFNRPSDVRKMVFMVWKHPGGDDDRWLYLPALDLVKRIAATEKRTSFAGSDFFYEDVSGRNLNDDTHTLVETTKDYFVVDNVPKDPKSVEFKHFKMWIHKESFITVKVEYYDKQDAKYREYQALKVDTIQGFPTVTSAVMKDLKSGSETSLSYANVVYNIGFPDDIFSERYLRKAPTKYLR